MEENNYQPNEQNQYYQSPNPAPQPKEEKASVGLAILSFLIPLAGLIIFLVDREKRPKTAKVSGICALVSFIISIAFSVIMTVTGGLLAGSLADDAIDDIYDDDSVYSDTIDAENGESTIVTDNTLGDYGCVVKDATLTKDWEGKDAVIVTFDFTNNSSEAASFDIALDAVAYQDGIGLETAILDDEETDYLDVEIKPGVTKEVKKAYVLRDTTTEVEIEVTEWLSFTDEKIVTTIDIAQ